MRKLMFAFLLLSITTTFAQKLVDYKIDKDVSMQMPEGFTLLDTLSQTIARANIGNNTILMTKISQQDTVSTVESLADLEQYYRKVQKGMLEGAHAKLLKREIVEIQGLKILKTSMSFSAAGKPTVWHGYMFFLNNYAYSLAFLISQPDTAFDAQEKKILSSLKFRNGLTVQDQFNNYESSTTAYKLGEIIGKLFFVVLFIVGAVYLIRKTRGSGL